MEGNWPRCPEAADLFLRLFQRYCEENPPVAAIASLLHQQAGVLLKDLVDHWVVPSYVLSTEELERVGLIETDVEGEAVWVHPQARLPRVRRGSRWGMVISVEDGEHFFSVHRLEPSAVEGETDSAYWQATCVLHNADFGVVVRKGYRGFRPGKLSDEEKVALVEARQRLRTRRRGSGGLLEAQRLAEDLVALLGAGRATDEFFAAERDYYMGRNRAASWQYGRQQELGIGWANHDHHTFRSSRENFASLMQLWKTLGFEFRERFYAGAEAGWGAQVLEHPSSRVVIFSDVDLTPDELAIDFATEALPQASEVDGHEPQLGTIGLWCALHGDSIEEAGMHHLEAEYDWEQVRSLLEANGHPVMKPFTDLPMLKQAFTEPEMWPVREERLRQLVERGQIQHEQAARFQRYGAAGSHLEILQRWEGYKGFNQAGVSAIIRATDARRIG